MSRTVVVTSIFGQQQAAVAQAFHEKNWTVRGTARASTSHAFAEIAQADIHTGAGLVEAFRGAEVVAFSLLQDHRPGVMEAMAKKVALAASEAGVKRIIFNLAGMIDESTNESPFTDMRAARAAIQSGSVPSTILQPTVYMDNLLAPWSLPSIVNNGVLAYPAPENAPISWISHRTLAAFFVAAADSSTAAGKEFKIGGPQALTAAELTAAIGEHIGKSLVYHRLPLEVMAAGLNEQLGAPAGDRIVRLYAYLDREPLAMAVDGSAALELGVEPERTQDFAARYAWKA